MKKLNSVAMSLGLCVTAACGGRHDNGNRDGGGSDSQPTPDGPPPIPADCMAAANRGVMWLVTQQQADGHWGSSFPVATTGFAVLKLETYAWEIGFSPFDPAFQYVNQVRTGLDYLFRNAQAVDITNQLAGAPDSNGNGTGIRFSSFMYENATSLMAIAAGREPDRVVTTSGSSVAGLTFKQIAADAVDYFSFAQSDSASSSGGNCTRGGWRYSAFDNAQGGDNSVTQWSTLSLEYARHPLYKYQIPMQGWVTTELRDWVTCIQNHDGTDNDGASGYTANTNILNAYKTGALIQQFSFLGDGPAVPNVKAALEFLHRKWTDTNGMGWRSQGTMASNYIAMYSIMKAMESEAITDLNGIDWYREFCDQLKLEQNADGSWPPSIYEQETVGTAGINSTEWALLVLERAAPPPDIIL